jgi:NAD+ synthase
MEKKLKILESIIKASPTDGLWADGRTDESQLGMSYKDLEKAILNPKDKNYEKFEN